jgi:phage regulator Rha-like protein
MEPVVIQQKIFEIRGVKVMFDFDLAILYNVDTKVLNQSVKRNTSRFPEDFMFQLTEPEWLGLRSQIVTSNRGGRRYLPYVFTEHGITMLASVLRSEQAIQMNIAIVKVFIAMRQIAKHYTIIAEHLNELRARVEIHDGALAQLYEAIEKLLDKKKIQENWEDRERIGFKK